MNTTILKKSSTVNYAAIKAIIFGSILGHLTFLIIVTVTPSFVLAGKLISYTTILQSLSIFSGIIILLYLGIILKKKREPEGKHSSRETNNEWQQKIQSALLKLEDEVHELRWKGYRQFIVDQKVSECVDHSIVSFYLKPYDRGELPRFKPGQHLSFRLDNVAGQLKPIIRCYSLSDSYHQDYYRISVKRVPAPRDKPDLPPGISSNHFHDFIKVGDCVDVKVPNGNFFLDLNGTSDVVLIAGGVGITPIFSMLKSLAEIKSKRKIWFFYGLINSEQYAMKDDIEKYCRQLEDVHLIVCYSRPLDDDIDENENIIKGRVSVELFKEMLPSNNFDYYMCGPGPMMGSVTQGLKDWGVPDKNVHLETFGPASVKKKETPKQTANIAVKFSSDAQSISWNGSYDNLLEFAEANDMDLPFGCRMGNCGACMTQIKSGEVDYPAGTPGFEFEPGHCLLCVSVPKNNLILDT